MIHWRLDQMNEACAQLTLFDCISGATFVILFNDPTMLRQLLDDIMVGTDKLSIDNTPLPEYVRREFPGRD